MVLRRVLNRIKHYLGETSLGTGMVEGSLVAGILCPALLPVALGTAVTSGALTVYNVVGHRRAWRGFLNQEYPRSPYVIGGERYESLGELLRRVRSREELDEDSLRRIIRSYLDGNLDRQISERLGQTVQACPCMNPYDLSGIIEKAQRFSEEIKIYLIEEVRRRIRELRRRGNEERVREYQELLERLYDYRPAIRIRYTR